MKLTMLKVVFFFFSLSVVLVSSQNWLTSSYVLNQNEFFSNVLQEMVYELERQEWCNLKLGNIYQTISDSLYNFRVNGTVTYHNGFLVSIQKIDIINVHSFLSSTTATVRGTLNLNDVTVGYDVEATLNNEGEVSVQTYTGTYNHNLVQYQISIVKNLDTKEISASSLLLSLAAGSGVRMIYMPTNNVTEALSRRWVAGNNWDGVASWGTNHMIPIILDIVKTRIPFPGICIGCNT